MSTFSGCSQFNGSLNIPQSVRMIDDSVFSDFSKLSGSIVILNSVRIIGYSSFSGCLNLDGDLTLSELVAKIGESLTINSEDKYVTLCNFNDDVLTLTIKPTEDQCEVSSDGNGNNKLSIG